MKNPGWVDLQVNGYGGVDFSAPTLTEDEFLRAAEGVLKAGVSLFLPTIVTSSAETYTRNLPLIHKAVEKHGLKKNIPGFHLEGPFLSPKPGAVGAHNPAWIQAPTEENFDRLYDLAGGAVKILTVAADQEGVCTVIRHAAGKGVVVSVGHHLATPADLRAAVAAGARTITHLGNGMPNLSDRHNNPLWAGAAEDDSIGMLICDGHHLPFEVIKCLLRIKGIDRSIVVSDASPVAGLPPGRYHLLGNDAILEPNGKFHNPEKGCLVGSSFVITQCMEYLESKNFLTEAELIQLGRTNPLKLLGML